MHKTKLRAAGVFLALTVALGVGVVIGVEERSGNTVSAAGTTTAPTITVSLNPDTQPAGLDMSQFWEAWNLLEQNYVVTHASSTIPSDQDKIYGAIAGLTDSYGDPYTVFFPPADAQAFEDDINGSFAGVGMEMAQDTSGNIVVTAPLKGSPAEAAGVKAGDIVTSIDATSTAGMAIDEAVDLIRGPAGTNVTLTIQRQGVTQPVVITITRQIINIPEIDSYDAGNGIFVIQLYTFTSNSADLFRTALRSFFTSGDTKLILDLRGNPGGYLDQAVDIASYFLPVGDTVVTEDFEGKQPNIVNYSLGYNVFANKKLSMAILINQDSASASEILSGALQQHGVAKLVGTRSFGKGSVQQLMDLGGGAELKITIARWLTPNGTSISQAGLTPDIEATTTAADTAAGRDPQMQAAIDYLETQ